MKAFVLIQREIGGGKAIIDMNTIKHSRSKIVREASYRNSLLFFQSMKIPFLFVALTITLLFSTLSSPSALGQCDGLCTHDQNAPQIKTAAEGVDTGYQESANAYFGPEEVKEPNRDPAVSNVNGISNEQTSTVFAGGRISVSQGLSDEFALDEMNSTGKVGENSGGSFYATNDNEANSSRQTSNSKDWEFILIPYGWFTGLSGDITVKGRTADVDATFFDLLDHLDIAGMFHGEVWWKGKIGFFADTTFAKLSVDGDISLPNSGSVNINNTTTLFLQEIGGLYRAGTWGIGSPENNFVQKSKPTITLDILAGGRYWYLKNELDIHGPFGILPSEIDASKHWFDFIVGGRVGLNFYKKLTFEVRTDVGGFGLGFSSNISWNIVSVIAYELPWYRITPIIGYRALYDDYSDGSGNNRFAYNAWMYGPVLGVAFRF